MLADGARAVVGPAPVAWAEDIAYGIDDRVSRLVRGGEKPVAYWDVPQASAPVGSAAEPAPAATTAQSAATARSAAAAPGPPPFRLDDVGPMHAIAAAPGDGTWIVIPDPRRPGDAPAMRKTLIHPDKNRGWSAVSVVAVDLAQVELHLVAGRHEPESADRAAAQYPRSAVVPTEHHPRLLAVFNGGYKGTHGHYGMKVDGVTLLPPRGFACAVARYDDGRIVVRPWEEIAPTEPRMRWWRQTPKCMYDAGKPHVALDAPNDSWGSTVASGTVIRRSAIGLDRDGRVLYVGIADWVTAAALAHAMKHAGAHDVAQLDVNFSYPKLLLFEPRAPGSPDLVARPLTKHFEFGEDDYVRVPHSRDFFYLTRKAEGPEPPK